jgi:pantothenate kinase
MAVTIYAPSFNHSIKGTASQAIIKVADPVESDISILPSHRIVILEGNYVHLTVPPWDQATKLLDERWFITVERAVARVRVIKRHLISGVTATEKDAGRRFDENDWPNGEYILENSDLQTADRIIHSIQDRDISKTE